MYTKRRFGLELEARLDEDYQAAALARWALTLLRRRDGLEPEVAREIAQAAAIAEQSQADRGTHALRALARSLSGKGGDYRPGALRERALFEILALLLEGPEAFDSLLRRLCRGLIGERDPEDLSLRLARLVALGWVDAGLLSDGQYRALGRLSPARLLDRRHGYHFSLSRAGADAWSDFAGRDREPTPPVRAR